MPRVKVFNPFVEGGITPEVSRTQIPTPTEIEGPSVGETFGAAFRRENSAVSAFANDALTEKRLEGYESLDDIEGYEEFALEFLDSHHPDDTAIIKNNIDRQREDSIVLQNSGAMGFMAQMAAGLTDPIYLPLMAIPGGALVKAGKASLPRMAALGAASEAVAELGKHATQETRTPLESIINVSGAAILSGVVGKGIDSLVNGRQIAKQINSDMVEPNYSVGSAAVVQNSFEDLELVNAGKIEQWGVSPIVRTSTSDAVTTRRIANEMMETPLVTKGNVSGKSTSPIGGTIETRVKKWQAPLAASIDNMEQQFRKYKLRVRGEGGKPMRKREFWEAVGSAGNRNDEHLIPEVSAASKFARQHLIEPSKQRAVTAGLIDDVAVKTAPSYFRRVYRHGKIIQQRPEWDEIVETWVREVDPNLSPPEVKAAAGSITDNILGSPGGRVPYEADVRGPLKGRVFDIPDERIDDFLEKNAEIVWNDYTRTMAPDVELAEHYGDVGLTTQIEEITADYGNLRAKTSDPAELTRLNKRMESDIKDIEAMRDRIRGVYLGGGDPNSFFTRAGRSIRDINFLRLLGGMTLSAIPDLSRIVAVNGLRTFKGLGQLIAHPKQMKASMRQMKKYAIGLDMTLNSRAQSIGSVDDVFQRNTAFERGLKQLSNTFGKVSLMAPWNASLKQFSGVITSDRIIDLSQKWAKGTITKNHMRRMAQAGIDEDMAVRIADQFAKYGDGDAALKLAQSNQWDDFEAAQTFASAVLRDVDRTIITPGKGELPLFTDHEFGKMVFQFKTFAASAHHKIVLADLQHRDAMALNGFLLSVALGGVAYGAKQFVAGRDISTDPEKLLVESLDRSGSFGYMWDVNNIIEKTTRGNVGVNALLGKEPMSRYASRNVMGAMLGPSFDTVGDTIEIAGDVTTGEVDEGTVRAVRKMLPYQNVFYIRRLLNAVEEEITE